MKQLAKRYGGKPNEDRFAKLSIIRLCCNEALASKRLEQAMTLIESEWEFAKAKASRRLWVEVAGNFIRTYR